jgi:tRNA A37 threonylcarbamoyladenosine synthetase subunit TsaC/SUA5/YrdC
VSTERIQWDGELTTRAVDLLDQGGKIVVTPTKVGYIIMTTDLEGLERKFAVKKRKRNKPGVVLCGSMEQLREVAEMTPEIERFYQMHWDQDALMGCILPWKESGKQYIPEGAEELMTDHRGTSCFVLRFGTPGEQIAQERWEKSRALSFASSANPSGRGNRGVVAGIGDAIESEADLIIEGDEYVASIQPDATPETRYEQGVMVSFVDDDGKLVPEQHGDRDITPAPILIRKGVYLPQILDNLAECFNSWDYRHGHYY